MCEFSIFSPLMSSGSLSWVLFGSLEAYRIVHFPFVHGFWIMGLIECLLVHIQRPVT